MVFYITQIPQDTTKPAPVYAPVLITPQEATTPIVPPQDTTLPVLDTTFKPEDTTPKVIKPVKKDSLAISQTINDTVRLKDTTEVFIQTYSGFPRKAPFPEAPPVIKPTVIHYDSSIFTSHLLKTDKIEPVKKSDNKNEWPLGIILFALLLVAIVRTVHYKKFKQYFNAFFTERMYFQLLREEHTLISPISLLLNIVSALIFALFFYQVINFYFPGSTSLQGFPLYLTIVFYISLILLSKLFLYRFTGAIFSVSKLVSDYLYTIILFINVISIALIPLVISIEYFEVLNPKILIFTGGVLLLISFLYRNYRGFTIANSAGNISGVYLFFYLCALEILPLIVLFKALMIVNQ